MSDLVLQGFNLVLYGMGTVFTFLTLLVGSTVLMSLLLRDPPKPVALAPEQMPSVSDVDPKMLAVVTAAVDAHRRRHS